MGINKQPLTGVEWASSATSTFVFIVSCQHPKKGWRWLRVHTIPLRLSLSRKCGKSFHQSLRESPPFSTEGIGSLGS